MLNWIFLFLIVAATVFGALTGTMREVTDHSIASAKNAVDLSISLIGQMALWLGVFQVLQDGGVVLVISRALKPIMSRLFPEVPADHPAMGAMIMNIAANMLGLTNACTPFGIKAMIELNKLNKHEGVATNSMVLFLAINTSGVAVLPTGAIAVRAAAGSTDATAIFLPTILATMCSTVVGVIAVKLLQRLPAFSAERYAEKAKADAGEVKKEEDVAGLAAAEEMVRHVMPASRIRGAIAATIVLAIGYGLVQRVMAFPPETSTIDVLRDLSAAWIMPILLCGILLVGFTQRIRVYESTVRGAKQGFQVGVMIIPFLVAILVAIGMFRGSGMMDEIVGVLSPYLSPLGFPPEAITMGIIRPLSGSGALAVHLEILKSAGPDSFTAFVVGNMGGSTETTFYVLAVYFGAVGVRAARHTVLACLAADFTGMCVAVALSHVFF